MTSVIVFGAYIVGVFVCYPLGAWATGRFSTPAHQFEDDYQGVVMFVLFWPVALAVIVIFVFMWAVGRPLLWADKAMRLAKIYTWFNERGRHGVDGR